MLSAFPNVDLTGIRSASDHGAVVELTYTDQANRIEQQTAFMDPITPADVEFALHADAFVCVPITDYEVGQATLAYIKSHSDGTILLDAHGPTSTLVIGGERKRRLWVERDSWLPHIDVLKMNLEEAGCSWFPSPDALAHHDAGNPIPEEQLPDFAEHCLRHGVQAVCVTLDQRGCVAYHLDAGGSLVEEQVAADRGGERRRHDRLRRLVRRGHGVRLPAGPRHRLGCRYGNAMGAQRVSGSGLDVYLPLRRDRQADRRHLRGEVVTEVTDSVSWLVERVRVRSPTRELPRDAVHGRQRLARHPRQPRGGPPRAAVGHVPRAACTTATRSR